MSIEISHLEERISSHRTQHIEMNHFMCRALWPMELLKKILLSSLFIVSNRLINTAMNLDLIKNVFFFFVKVG